MDRCCRKKSEFSSAVILNMPRRAKDAVTNRLFQHQSRHEEMFDKVALLVGRPRNRGPGLRTTSMSRQRAKTLPRFASSWSS